MRIALIVSLLIFCFENFHGDILHAINNVKSAVEFMYSWLEKQNEFSMSRSLSPAPVVVEDELGATFFRLSRYMVLFHGRVEDKYPKAKRTVDPFANLLSAPEQCINTASNHVLSMPSTFATLAEAKFYWDMVLEYVTEYVARVRTTNKACSEPREGGLDENHPLFPQRDILIKAIDRWSSAFAPILQYSRTPRGDEQFVIAATLHVECIVTDIDLRGVGLPGPGISRPGTECDLFLSQYQEVVSISKDAIEHPRFLRSFVLDIGIVCYLFAVAMKCRDHTTRRAAISLMKMAGPRREAFWDSEMLVQIAEEAMRLEENKAPSIVQFRDIQVPEFELKFQTLTLVDRGVNYEQEVRPTIGSGILGWESKESCKARWATFWRCVRR